MYSSLSGLLWKADQLFGNCRLKFDVLGFHALTFDCRGYWIWTWEFHPRTDERPIPEEADTDLFGLPRHRGCGRKSLQQSPCDEAVDAERRFSGKLSVESHPVVC